jgi:hypothetical protein
MEGISGILKRHTQMAHHKHRLQRSVRAGPGIKEGIGVDFFQFEGGVPERLESVYTGVSRTLNRNKE